MTTSHAAPQRGTGGDLGSRATLLHDLLADLDPDIIQPWSGAEHERHLHDYSGRSAGEGTPLALARPRTTAEVADLAAAAARLGIAMVPQGGRTGLAGGAHPIANSLVLSLERMNRIEEVDRAAALIVVEAGVPLQRVQEAAAEAGLLFPLDLGARGSAQIGGLASTNAGGVRVLRYGMMRDLTLGLEAVLPDGTVVDAMNRMIKNNAGYDLKHLFIGSEGTLGIVTRLVLRLHPAPASRNAALLAVDGYDAVLAVLAEARTRLGESLSAFEVMWDDFFAVATAGSERPIAFEEAPSHVVLIEIWGRDQSTDGALMDEFAAAMFAAKLVSDARISRSEREIDAFWAIRDTSGELGRRFGPAVNFDVSLPVGEIDAFARACRQRLRQDDADAQVLVFGHIADGNIHLACRDAAGTRKHAIETIVYGVVREWGGSITAEHGIGVEKRAFLPWSRPATYLGLMRVIKEAVDPANLMNPGKVLGEGDGA